MKRFAFLATLTAFAFAGCGQVTNPQSKTKDIATDLPDNGGSNLPKEIYYLQSGIINRARCPIEATFYTRVICTGRTQRMDYSQFKTELNNGLSALVVNLTQESERIQTALDGIQKQIRALQKEIDHIEETQGGLSNELKLLRAEIAKLDIWIEEGRSQVRNINEHLRRAANGDLALQRDYIIGEIAKLESRITQANQRLTEIVNQLASINSQVAALKVEMDKLSNRATNLNADLTIVKDKLARATSDLSVYNETISDLEEGGISYIVTSDNALHRSIRQFVKRFDEIFDRHTAG